MWTIPPISNVDICFLLQLIEDDISGSDITIPSAADSGPPGSVEPGGCSDFFALVRDRTYALLVTVKSGGGYP